MKLFDFFKRKKEVLPPRKKTATSVLYIYFLDQHSTNSSYLSWSCWDLPEDYKPDPSSEDHAWKELFDWFNQETTEQYIFRTGDSATILVRKNISHIHEVVRVK